MSQQLQKIGHSALSNNQAFMITLLIAALILNVAWLARVVAVIMLLGTATQRPALRRRQDLLDDQGHPLHVNYGVTPTEKLLQQLPVMAGKPLPGV